MKVNYSLRKYDLYVQHMINSKKNVCFGNIILLHFVDKTISFLNPLPPVATASPKSPRIANTRGGGGGGGEGICVFGCHFKLPSNMIRGTTTHDHLTSLLYNIWLR